MKYLVIAGTILLTGSLTYGQTDQQDGNPQYSTPQTAVAARVSPVDHSGQNARMRRSRDAMRVLADTNQARDAISQGDAAKASASIQAALAAISNIEAAQAPSQSDRNLNIVPIYTELGEASVVGPVYRQQRLHPTETEPGAQGSANRMEETPQSTNPEAGNRAHGVAVTGLAESFTSLTLNLDMARDHLQAAQQALANGNLNLADAALAAVQNGVSMVSIAADRPLLRARENLILARQAAEQGQYARMQAPLMAAARALDTYCSGSDIQHAEEARQLSREIRAYAGGLTGQSQPGSVDRIDGWWELAGSWTQPR